MNKVICDVCGTDYPETASQCPICGCATVGGQTSLGNVASGEEENGSYTPVKGGRFSKSNVRKRLKANQVQESRIVEPEPNDMDDDENDDMEPEETSNRGLIVIVVLLLLAIIAVSVYIAISIFGVGSGDETAPTRNPVVQTDPTTASTEQTEKRIPCSSLTLGDMEINLQNEGSVWDLDVTAKPVDTTDQLLFTSSDESVVTVDPITGRVTAVGEGEATVIVRCGDATVECPVTCVFPTEPTDATEDPDTTTPTDETDPTEGGDPEGTTEPTKDPDAFVLELRRFDFTMTTEGETFRLYNGDISAFEITWTSEDESVATIENGIVTAVGRGTTKVIAEYDGQKAVCIVRCNLPEEDTTEDPTEDTETTTPTETTKPEETTEPEATEPEEATTPSEDTQETENTETDSNSPAYVLRKNGFKCTYGDDFSAYATITVGEAFKLAIVNADNEAQDVTWSASKEGVCTVTGTTVKGTGTGKVKLSVTYEGNTYTCEIIVR